MVGFLVIVLDTHIWIWWIASPNKLSPTSIQAIENEIPHKGLRISSISAWEVAMLVSRGRLELTMDAAAWIARSEALPFIRFIPIDNRIALRAVSLPASAPSDPADRIIAATALTLGTPIVTMDKRMGTIENLRIIR